MRRFLLAISFVFCCTLVSGQELTEGQFARVHALIKPGPGEEKWNQIPWQSSLWEARKLAAAQGKPILLWEMDGNPLGCT